MISIIGLIGRGYRALVKHAVPLRCRRTIRALVVLWDAAANDEQPYCCFLIYRKRDPFAVTLLVPDHKTDRVIEIVFARGLLIDGLDDPAGDGVVRVEPHILDPLYSTVTLPLTSDGTEFFTERGQLEDFVLDTCALVPSGAERGRVSAELDRWLAGVAR